MAERGYVESFLNRLPAEQRPAWKSVFNYVLTEFRFGMPADRSKATNHLGYFYETTTPATPGDEFSIAHGLTGPPYLAIPVLSLQDVGCSVVPLTVSRAADASRIYLTSTVASAPVRLLVEGG